MKVQVGLYVLHIQSVQGSATALQKKFLYAICKRFNFQLWTLRTSVFIARVEGRRCQHHNVTSTRNTHAKPNLLQMVVGKIIISGRPY